MQRASARTRIQVTISATAPIIVTTERSLSLGTVVGMGAAAAISVARVWTPLNLLAPEAGERGSESKESMSVRFFGLEVAAVWLPREPFPGPALRPRGQLTRDAIGVTFLRAAVGPGGAPCGTETGLKTEA